MSTCIRNGVRYKRHKMIDRKCFHCGAIFVPTESRDEIVRTIGRRLAAAMEEIVKQHNIAEEPNLIDAAER